MRQTKIIVNKNRKEPFVILEKTGLFFREIETTPTHEEAIIYCQGRGGKFLGTYIDGVLAAVSDLPIAGNSNNKLEMK
jgi:hypothetical protein